LIANPKGRIAQVLRADPKALTASLLVTAGRQLAERADRVNGGLGGAPKFPSSSPRSRSRPRRNADR